MGATAIAIILAAPNPAKAADRSPWLPNNTFAGTWEVHNDTYNCTERLSNIHGVSVGNAYLPPGQSQFFFGSYSQQNCADPQDNESRYVVIAVTSSGSVRFGYSDNIPFVTTVPSYIGSVSWSSTTLTFLYTIVRHTEIYSQIGH